LVHKPVFLLLSLSLVLVLRGTDCSCFVSLRFGVEKPFGKMFTGVRVRTRDEPRIREHLVVRCPHRLVLARPAAIHDLSSVSSTQVPLPLACPAAPPFRDPPPLRSYIQHLRETERRSERENYAIGQVRKRERGEDKRAAKRRRGMRRAQCLPGTSAGLTSSPRRGPTGS